MIEVIKKLDCVGYLLVYTNIPHIKPATIPLRVRWQIKSRLKQLGFMPFLTGWMIKPLFNFGDLTQTKKNLISDKYDLPVKMIFIYLNKNDFEFFETVTLEKKD